MNAPPKPSVCRLVQVILPGFGEEDPFAAVVTDLGHVTIDRNGQEVAAIAVTPFPKPGLMESLPTVMLLPADPGVRNTKGAYWRWPPRE